MPPSNLNREKFIVILGESGVGKTCLTDRFTHDGRFVRYDPFPDPHAGENNCRRVFSVDNELWAINMDDLSLTALLHSDVSFRRGIFEQIIRNADGVILLYDVTSKSSYDSITKEGYKEVWNCRRTANHSGEDYLTRRQRFGCVLVGNKADLVEGDADKWRRQVRKGVAEEWASMHGTRFYEMDSFTREGIEEAMRGLVRSITRAERRDAEDLEGKRKEEAEKKRIADESSAKKSKETSGLSRSFSKLRDALPRIKAKSKASKS